MRIRAINIEKGNPNRDPATGQFTFGAGGPQASASGAGGSGEKFSTGKDITGDLAKEYGDTAETDKARDLRVEHMNANYDPVLKDIAAKQGFDGKADLVDQETFDKIVAEGGTVTHRGIGSYWENPSPNAPRIEGETAITENFAKGGYFAGGGGYGSGTYTTSDAEVAQHYATESGTGGGVVTMVIKPGAKIATPKEWADARIAAHEGKGGFMGADNPGRILAAKGFDGYRIASPNVDHFSNAFTVILNRKAVAVLKK